MFIESGAFTGESLSNTLHFEATRGWTGLLIEPDQKNYATLKSKQRKAYTANACLSVTSHPKYVSL